MRVSFWFIIVSVVLLSIPFLVTQHKGLLISAYNKYRVVFLDGGGEKCLRELEQAEAVFIGWLYVWESRGSKNLDIAA